MSRKNIIKVDPIRSTLSASYNIMYLNFETWEKEEKKKNNYCNSSSDEIAALKVWSHKYRAAITGTIIYSALSLEEFINYCGKTKKIKGITDYEDSISTKNKYQLYPQIISNKYLKIQILSDIGSIFKLRNMLVHPKPEFKSKRKKKTTFSIEHGRMLIKMTNGILKETSELVEINLNWLKENKPGTSKTWSNIEI